MFKNASVADWYRQYGRHGVYAGNRPMPVPEFEHTVRLPAEIARRTASSEARQGEGGCGESAEGGCGCSH
jgi:hypothetical protein